MITLKKLYFDPDNYNGKTLRTVNFSKGLNLIVGESIESSRDSKEHRKMNGVGKSLLIEAINFCLFKKADESRVTRIPAINFPEHINFCLDLEVVRNGVVTDITIKRNRKDSSKIKIITNGNEADYDISSAKKYLEFCFYGDNESDIEKPSLRSLLAILIRDEDTKYADILRPSPTSSLVAFEDLLKPHLFLFGIDLLILDELKEISKEIKQTKKLIASYRKDFIREDVDEKEVASYINDLKGSIDKLNLAIESLRPSEALLQEKASLYEMELKLKKLVGEKVSLEYLVNKIKQMPTVKKVSTKQVANVYNFFSAGLGDLVKKSFDDVLEFKNQVEIFQQTLMGEKMVELNKDIQKVTTEISEIDSKISLIYKKHNAKEKVESIREALRLEREKNIKLEQLSALYESLQAKKALKSDLAKKKAGCISELGVALFKIQNTINSFQTDLTEMHEFIAGNKYCQFVIDIEDNKANYLNFDQYRIRLDGSSGINRIKVFMYDLLLLTNKFTSEKHFGFLIHDNIFASTGKDDMVKSLNFLSLLSKHKDFQYIVTINKDEFDSHIDEFTFDYKRFIKAELTRDNPFIGIVYSQL